MYQVDVYEFPVFYLLRNKVKRALFHIFCAKKKYLYRYVGWMNGFSVFYEIARGEVYYYEKCQDVWHLVKVLD